MNHTKEKITVFISTFIVIIYYKQDLTTPLNILEILLKFRQSQQKKNHPKITNNSKNTIK
ncbi:hypothetical protein EG359_11360 [Chryseobacterium joostei]|uniref:Uncharacterized protein n=1 Tax=Chryseobacterium joostei TaxID=112234 RepID=A0A1N7IGZ9_9FLAO|nr:hypothetical protein EG347_10765 [Chryseobacterium sp. G0186]AZB00184.1 hypothetical protein EG359_11360 [Chryseobacterium joostei]SIS36348.1 hypothetical protein SAMN05421768_105192 [Chryseobacterium joostei]